jgi:hypothetical protein
LYVKAAEGFLHLFQGTTEDAGKTRWKKEAEKALERAGKIKGVKGQSGLRGVELDFWSHGAQMLYSMCGGLADWMLDIV